MLFQLRVDQNRSLHILEIDEFLILKIAFFMLKKLYIYQYENMYI